MVAERRLDGQAPGGRHVSRNADMDIIQPAAGSSLGRLRRPLSEEGRPGAAGHYRYEGVASGSASDLPGRSGNNGTDGSDLRPQPQRGISIKVRWAVPPAAFFGALFLQTSAAYSATGAYISWMDSGLGDAKAAAAGAPGAGPSSRNGHIQDWATGALQDTIHSILGLPAQSSEASTGKASWFDWLTSLLPFVWLAVVLRSRNLQLWSRTLFCGALVAILQALLAWSTILPNAGGWEECQAKLGADGLAYYREDDAGVVASLADVFALAASGLFPFAQRSLLCSELVLSDSSCLFALFSYGLYNAAQKREFPLNPLVVALVLILVAACDSGEALASRVHYTTGVVSAFMCTLLIYSNPALAIATETWANGRLMAEPGVIDDPKIPRDVAVIDTYHLRPYIDHTKSTPEEEVTQIVIPVRSKFDAAANQLDQLRHALHEQKRLTEAAVQRKQLELESLNCQLEEFTKQNEKHMSEVLRSEEEKLKCELQMAYKLEDKVFDQVQRFSKIEAEFEEERVRLIRDTERIHEEIAAGAAHRSAAHEDTQRVRRESEELRHSISEREDVLRGAAARLDDTSDTEEAQAPQPDDPEAPVLEEASGGRKRHNSRHDHLCEPEDILPAAAARLDTTIDTEEAQAPQPAHPPPLSPSDDLEAPVPEAQASASSLSPRNRRPARHDHLCEPEAHPTEDSTGPHEVLFEDGLPVSELHDRDSREVARLAVGARVEVLEIDPVRQEGRVRGRIKEPPGYITMRRATLLFVRPISDEEDTQVQSHVETWACPDCHAENDGNDDQCKRQSRGCTGMRPRRS